MILVPSLQHSDYLKFIQINLRHSKVASASLAQLLLERDIEIVLKYKEHYVVLSSELFLANVSSRYSSFHSLSREHAYGAAIIVKKISGSSL